MKRLFFFALILIVSACNSDDDTTPTDPAITTNDIHLLKKIYLNDELFSERIYTADSTLIRIDSYRADTIRFYTEYSYLGDVTRTSFFQSNDDLTNYRDTYELSDGNVREDRFDGDGVLKNYTILTFDDDNCSYTKRELFDENDVFLSLVELTYTDENCSFTSTSFDSNMDIQFTDQLIRDDGSVYHHFSLLDLLRINKQGSTIENNIWDADGVLLDENSYTAVVEYNDAGYLLSNVRTYADGEIQHYTYEY